MPPGIRRIARRSWRILAGAVLLSLLLLALWLAAVIAFALGERPAVSGGPAVAPQDIERALQILKRHDPRWQVPGVVRAVAIEERDLNLLLEQATHRVPGLAARARLDKDRIDVALSVDLARWAQRSKLSWPGGRRSWLDAQLRLSGGNGLPRIERAALGPVPVPAWLANWAAAWVLERSLPGVDRDLLQKLIRRVEPRPRQMLLFYVWQDELSARVLNGWTSPEEQQRLRAYAERLAAWSQNPVPEARAGSAAQPAPVRRSSVSVAALLESLFELARQRTQAGGDAVAENRAALLTATLYANRRAMTALVPAARHWPWPRWWVVTLAGRTDTPLHFLISAALAAEQGTPLADAVGLYKELQDSRGGSGFSFHDLAADRAGTRFGDVATRAPARLQAAAQGLREADLLPDVADMPESMSSEQFEQRFGGTGAPAYARMVAEIESRLDTVPLLR